MLLLKLQIYKRRLLEKYSNIFGLDACGSKKISSKGQEACRKDVECAFEVLQLRFAIVVGPARFE